MFFYRYELSQLSKNCQNQNFPTRKNFANTEYGIKNILDLFRVRFRSYTIKKKI